MADMTQIELAMEEAKFLSSMSNKIIASIHPSYLKNNKVDCTTCSANIRLMRSAIDRLADNIFTVNREQRGSDEAIQKQQILYAKQLEREKEAARVAAEAAEVRAERFEL